MKNKKINEAEILQDLTQQAKNVVKFQRDAAIKAALKAAKSSTGILTPARKAAKEKAKLAKSVADKLRHAGQNPSDVEIMKIAGLESKQIFQSTVEDAQAGITTGNVGSPNMSTGEPAKFGNSSIYAPKVGPMISRKGDIPFKKKKKKVREFVEFYNENEQDHRLDVEKEVKKARKENNAEKVVYYSQLGNTSASTSFEKFKGSWAYEQWKKKNKEAIEKEEQELKRFSYMR